MSIGKSIIMAGVFFITFNATSTQARTICTLVVDAASGDTISESGQCETRTTPASTFKVALALIGYDAGVLKSPTNPKLPFRKGYVDWAGKVWRQDTTPLRWLKYSVVWYSQQVTRRIGAETITTYLEKLNYGNADFSGDAGYDNALERAWIASSLEISPREQVQFLKNMLAYRLPVKTEAIELTKSIVEQHETGTGWLVHGKTGLAFPRNADRTFNRQKGWGWFVGWANNGNRRIVFARLIQDEKQQSTNPSQRAKQSLLDDLPGLIAKPTGSNSHEEK